MPLNTEYVPCLHDFDDAVVAPTRGLEKRTRVGYGLVVVRIDLVHIFEHSRSEGAFLDRQPMAHRREHRPQIVTEMPMKARRR